MAVMMRMTHHAQHLSVAAQKAVADELMANSDANRVMAETDAENFAEQRSRESAGLTREDVARATQWRKRVWLNCVICSRIGSDPIERSAVPNKCHQNDMGSRWPSNGSRLSFRFLATDEPS